MEQPTFISFRSTEVKHPKAAVFLRCLNIIKKTNFDSNLFFLVVMRWGMGHFVHLGFLLSLGLLWPQITLHPLSFMRLIVS